VTIYVCCVVFLIQQDQMEQASKEGSPPMPLTIVFVERKNRCNEVAQALADEGVPAVALHGGLTQVWCGVVWWPVAGQVCINNLGHILCDAAAVPSRLS